MKPLNSPLQLLDFAITKMEYRVVDPHKITHDVSKYFEEYDLDIDFGMTKQDDYLRVFVIAEINKDKSTPGYSLTAEATSIFRISDPNLPEETLFNLEGFSSIYIALNCLRGLVSSFTSSGPIGRYILPSIDLNDLIKQKRGKILNQQKKQPVKPKSTPQKGSKLKGSHKS